MMTSLSANMNISATKNEKKFKSIARTVLLLNSILDNDSALPSFFLENLQIDIRITVEPL